ncbi:hypothetical protein OKW38_002975 [Paraburkholderia sp. MM5496-R1]|uniref:hypothetical protein n=1 Tax=unclassified Paraburkholderia TaxID=2615204 RepID=UPI003D262FC3
MPLTSDWQCALVPAHDVQEVDRGWKLSYEERQKARKEREEQIEQDQRDFDRLFRVSTRRRDARGCSDFSTYAAFISEHLSISCLGAPVDGESVTRILRDAVRDGRLVPAINRAWRGSRRVARPYGPQSWPKRVPDTKPTVYGFLDGQLVPFGADGRLIERTPYASPSSSSRFDWLGAVGAMAGAAIGGARFAVNGGNGAGAIANPTLLGDAKPFAYVPEALSGDVVELAASTNNPNYAAKMLGYDRKTFGAILHRFKPGNGLGPADNVIWHDNGDVYFNGDHIGNFHDWAN